MFYFSIRIDNPFSNRFDTLKSWDGKTFLPNKYWEFEIMKDYTIVSIDINMRYRTDHGGFEIELGLLGYAIRLNFYDNRHWDEELGKYCSYKEE